MSEDTREPFEADESEQDEMQAGDMLRDCLDSLALYESRYRALFERITSGVVLCRVRDGAVLVGDVNAAVERMEKVVREEIVGRPLTQALPQAAQSGLEDTVLRISQGGRPEEFSMIFHDDADLTAWREARAFRLESGEIAVVYDDVTEKRLADLAIRESEARFRAQAESAHDAIVVLDSKGAIQFWNPAAERMFGWAAEEVQGRDLHELVATEGDRDKAARGMPAFAMSGQGPVVGSAQEMTARRRDGSEFPVERSVSSYRLGGQWYAVGSVRDITERKVAEDRLREMATMDGLTGIMNRRYFMERAAAEIHRAERYGGPLAAIMFDADHFKRVNDTYGHDAGDDVLRFLTEAAGHGLRDADLLGRLGGEEFAVVLPQTPLAGAAEVAERLRERIADKPIATRQGPVPLTISLGVALWDESVKDVDALIKRADLALYRAKEGGRDKVVLFDPDDGE